MCVTIIWHTPWKGKGKPQRLMACSGRNSGGAIPGHARSDATTSYSGGATPGRARSDATRSYSGGATTGRARSDATTSYSGGATPGRARSDATTSYLYICLQRGVRNRRILTRSVRPYKIHVAASDDDDDDESEVGRRADDSDSQCHRGHSWSLNTVSTLSSLTTTDHVHCRHNGVSLNTHSTPQCLNADSVKPGLGLGWVKFNVSPNTL